LNMGRVEDGMQDMLAAQKEKATPEHDVIDEAIRERGEGYTVFSIPVGILFRPNPNKIKNLQAKDYLGKARLISNDGSKYEVFDGVDPSLLAFRRDRARPTDTSGPGRQPETTPPQPETGANLGRSSSDIVGTSAPRNPVGLSRAATTAVSNPTRPGTGTRREPEPLARAATTVRPLRPRSPATRNPAPGPTRGLSERRPPGGLKQPASPPKDAADPRLTESHDSYSGRAPPQSQQAAGNEWMISPVRVASPTRAPSRSASAMGARSQAGNLSRSPSQYTVRRAPSRKGTMMSYRARSYDEEEGYASGSGEFDEAPVPFEVTKIRVKVCRLVVAVL
jgi:hypothetical protein